MVCMQQHGVFVLMRLHPLSLGEGGGVWIGVGVGAAIYYHCQINCISSLLTNQHKGLEYSGYVVASLHSAVCHHIAEDPTTSGPLLLIYNFLPSVKLNITK